MAIDNKKPACTRHELQQARFLIRHVDYKKQPVSVIIFAFEESVYAYIN